MADSDDTRRRVAAIGLHVAAVKCRELGMTWQDFIAIAVDVWDNSFKYVSEALHDQPKEQDR